MGSDRNHASSRGKPKPGPLGSVVYSFDTTLSISPGEFSERVVCCSKCSELFMIFVLTNGPGNFHLLCNFLEKKNVFDANIKNYCRTQVENILNTEVQIVKG